jgi:hypothetical protein
MSDLVYLRPNERADGFELCVMGDTFAVIPLTKSSLLRLVEEASAALVQTVRNDKRAGCKCADKSVGGKGGPGVSIVWADGSHCGND